MCYPIILIYWNGSEKAGILGQGQWEAKLAKMLMALISNSILLVSVHVYRYSVHSDVLQQSASTWHFPHVLRLQFPEVTARMAGFLEVKFASDLKASAWGRLLCTY